MSASRRSRPPALVVDGARQLVALGGARGSRSSRLLDGPGDGGERGAQVVRHGRQQVVAEALGLDLEPRPRAPPRRGGSARAPPPPGWRTPRPGEPGQAGADAGDRTASTPEVTPPAATGTRREGDARQGVGAAAGRLAVIERPSGATDSSAVAGFPHRGTSRGARARPIGDPTSRTTSTSSDSPTERAVASQMARRPAAPASDLARLEQRLGPLLPLAGRPLPAGGSSRPGRSWPGPLRA